ncbi:MAG: DUF1697 domain-containing protein [Candidatus Methanoperedens sp.]|nr:DUF1697 domain-containing protein [Candidatus Methanoperedens sp.]
MTKYIAFLRGINVGGHKPVKMEELKKAFEAMGFKNVKTLLASGNVLFETPETDTDNLIKRIEEELENELGHEIGVLLRTIEEIQSLVDADPFKNIKVTPQTRFYVTFLSEKPESTLKIPYESIEKDIKIVQVSASEVCSFITLSPIRGTSDLMSVLEKEFGRKVTTRNWNTVTRILKG